MSTENQNAIDANEVEPIYPVDCENLDDSKPYRFFESDGTTEVVAIRDCHTCCNMLPRNNHVIIKNTWRVPGMLLNDEKSLKSQLEPYKKEIVAIQDSNSAFQIGDVIEVAAGSSIMPVMVKGNNLNIKNVMEVYKDGFQKHKTDKAYSGRIYEAVDYYLVPAVIIAAIQL